MPCSDPASATSTSSYSSFSSSVRSNEKYPHNGKRAKDIYLRSAGPVSLPRGALPNLNTDCIPCLSLPEFVEKVKSD